MAAPIAAFAGDSGGAPVWSDEFNLPAGSAPDAAKWSRDLGGNGWGNNELETYTDKLENASIVDDPDASDGKALAIRAIRTSSGYTSARLKTEGKYSVLSGRVEARMKLPRGKGIWPAFWMLGDVINGVGWPDCGEIDVMEFLGHRTGRVTGTLHGPGYSGGRGIQGAFSLPEGGGFDQAYHVFAIDWSRERIAWLVDGKVYFEATPASLPPGARWVFDDHPFHILINLAVGGNWPGTPDASTVFPQTCLVDYVRVYTPATAASTTGTLSTPEPAAP